jgi:hypothetical protein
MPRPSTHTQWSQPSLMPVHWPLIELQTRWLIPADLTPTMVSYDVHGVTGDRTLLAKGIDWCTSIFDEPQRAELHHDLIRRALEHLHPF